MCASYRILECARNGNFNFYYIDLSVLWVVLQIHQCTDLLTQITRSYLVI